MLAMKVTISVGLKDAMRPAEPTIDLYDLLDALIERVPWRTETEKDQYKKLVVKHREINLFGYMATKITSERFVR